MKKPFKTENKKSKTNMEPQFHTHYPPQQLTADHGVQSIHLLSIPPVALSFNFHSLQHAVNK